MDTICAIATPSGGALGIVRVSGPQAISATSEIFKPKGSMPLDQRHGGTITFGNIINPDTDELIDEVSSVCFAHHIHIQAKIPAKYHVMVLNIFLRKLLDCCSHKAVAWHALVNIQKGPF